MKAAWIVALGLACVPTLAWADEVEPLANDVVKDRASVVPQRKYAAIKGKAVGVLVSDVKGVMANEGRGGPPDAMGFSADGNSYRWIYVPTPDAKNPLITNLQVETGEKADAGRKVYPALGMANAKEVARWKIDVAYSLVEVEVNDGLGSPPTEGFVATKMTRVDGTEAFPLKLPDVLADAKKRYQAHVKGRQKRIDAEMDDVQKKTLKGRKVTGPKTTDELMYLTWKADAKRLVVAFRTKSNDGAFTKTLIQGGGRGPFPLPVPDRKGGGKEKRAFFPPPPPRDVEVVTGLAFGVELGAVYEYDVKGNLASRSELTPKAFSHELQQPPGAGPRD